MSIRVRLLLLVIAAALLPALFDGWRYVQDRSRNIDAAISGLAATARTVASSLDAKIQSTAQLHFGLARARDLISRDKAACSGFLSDVLDKNPQFTGLLTIDPDGKLFCDSLRSGRVLDLRDRNYFQRALVTTGSVVLEPVFGRLTGAAVLQIAYPARDEALQLQFVLLASLDLNKFIAELAANLPQGFELMLAANNGTVLGWSSAQPLGVPVVNADLIRLAKQTMNGPTEVIDPEGQAQVWAVADSTQVGGVSMHVLVGRSKSELVAEPNRRLAEDVLLLVVVSLLLFAGAWLLAELGIRSQIGRIAAMAKRLGGGELEARIPPPFPKGELGALMAVLNGSAASLQSQRRDIEDLNGKLRRSQRLEAEEKQRLDIALNNMTQGLLLFDADERISVCNKRFIAMYGLSPDVVVPGCGFRELVTHRQATGSFQGDVEEYCSRALRELAINKVTQFMLETADGRSIQIVNQALAGGGWVSTHEDVTLRTQAEARIAHLAHYDALTELPNRLLFRQQLERALATLAPGEQLAVMYIDIDEFKSINDSLGHPVGDELLKTIARRLRDCLGADEFVARLGGDEFAIIQAGVRSTSDTDDVVARAYRAIRAPCECEGHLLASDASIGVALAPAHGGDLNQLLKCADLAMYAAKAEGRHTCRMFEPGMDARAQALRTLEMDLRRAIGDGGFELYYQPLIALQDDSVCGCEALLRWRHPTRGMISPADFIPVAEDTGLINQLGEWVLTTACTEAVGWPAHVKLAVNVSPVQFRSAAFGLKVATALAVSGLPAHRLELEITEAVLIRDDEGALAMLHQLRALGVGIALDDFGTGYSSLSYLQRFPFDKIKIDRCFIKDIAEPGGSSCIVQAVVNIAAARHITTTAEGVETAQQLGELRKLGCTEMQGYLYSPALPAAEIATLLRGRPSAMAGAA